MQEPLSATSLFYNLEKGQSRLYRVETSFSIAPSRSRRCTRPEPFTTAASMSEIGSTTVDRLLSDHVLENNG